MQQVANGNFQFPGVETWRLHNTVIILNYGLPSTTFCHFNMLVYFSEEI